MNALNMQQEERCPSRNRKIMIKTLEAGTLGVTNGLRIGGLVWPKQNACWRAEEVKWGRVNHTGFSVLGLGAWTSFL